MLSDGQIIDGHVVLSKIGEGGFAAVYRVERQSDGAQRALKVLLAEHLVNPRIRRRFADEAKVQAELIHPNLVRVYGIVAAEGVAGIYMELLEGETLAARIARVGAIPTDQLRPIALGVLSGLEFAHQAGVVHRDIKPENIFLVPGEEGGETAKILDFGIAKIRGELRSQTAKGNTTQVGSAMGTHGYMSPEQVRSASEVDLRTDIFALGATLFEAMSGKEPFPGATAPDVMVAVLNHHVRLDDALHSQDPTFAEAISGALAKDRDRRLQHCAAFRDAMELRVFVQPIVGEPNRDAPDADEDAILLEFGPVGAPIRTTRWFTAPVIRISGSRWDEIGFGDSSLETQSRLRRRGATWSLLETNFDGDTYREVPRVRAIDDGETVRLGRTEIKVVTMQRVSRCEPKPALLDWSRPWGGLRLHVERPGKAAWTLDYGEDELVTIRDRKPASSDVACARRSVHRSCRPLRAGGSRSSP